MVDTNSIEYLRLKKEFRGKAYKILDNGFVPYIVCLKNNTAFIYENNVKTHTFTKLYKSIKYIHALIGIDTNNRSYNGNSILLHIKNNEYICINSKGIFSFSSLSKIVKFISVIGNSGVPYPYAIDDTHNAYILIDEYKKMRNTIPAFKLPNKLDDIYNYYYNEKKINLIKILTKKVRDRYMPSF